MTTAYDIDLPAVLAERITADHPDVLRELLANNRGISERMAAAVVGTDGLLALRGLSAEARTLLNL